MKYEEFIKKPFEEILKIAETKSDKTIYELALGFYNDENKIIQLIEKNIESLNYMYGNKSLLYKLIEFKHENVLIYFKKYFNLQDYDKSSNQYNILSLLIKHGLKKTIEESLKVNNKVLNIKDKQGYLGVELLINAKYNSILLDNAEDIELNNRNEYGHYAYTKLLGQPDVIKKALKNNNNLIILNKRNDSGKSGVQVLAEHNLHDVLLEYASHINLNIKSNSYKTILSDLANKGYEDVIIKALANNNNTDVLNKRNDYGEPGSEVLAKNKMENALLEYADYIDITVKNSNGYKFVINDLINCPKALIKIIKNKPELIHKRDGYGKSGVQILAENNLENILLIFSKNIDISIKDSSGYRYIINSLIKFPKVLEICYENEKNLININMRDDYGKTNVEILAENNYEEILDKSSKYIDLKAKASNYKYNFHFLLKYPKVLKKCLEINSDILNKTDSYGIYYTQRLIENNLNSILLSNIKSINWDIKIKGYPIVEYLVKENSTLLTQILNENPYLINKFIKEIINKDDVNRYLKNDEILIQIDETLKYKNLNIMALLSKKYENHVERYYELKNGGIKKIISDDEIKNRLNTIPDALKNKREDAEIKKTKSKEIINKKGESIDKNKEKIEYGNYGEKIIKKEDFGFKKYKKML